MDKRPRRACDACYIQKIRCQPQGEARALRREPSIKPSTDGEEDGQRRCRQCQLLDIACTFERPTKTRVVPTTPSRLSTECFSGLQSSSAFDLPRDQLSGADPLDFQSLSGTNSHTRTSLWASFSACSTGTLDRILQSFFLTIYPITPVVCPASLEAYFSNPDSCSVPEPEAFSLVLSICAYYIVTFPRKFHDYKAQDCNLRPSSCREFLQECEEFIQSLRPREYFEIGSHAKCLTAYYMTLAAGLIGLPGRAY
ncbi:hypothetical protein BJY04DRAFT_220137 [Aspergillus karnatakaensis]|uniref:fungal specific transcription factor domain-containing protein n=1 Tax=Aspergillus karnatakaensis TaxID=1810916 RepID=UPI003CCCC4C3